MPNPPSMGPPLPEPRRSGRRSAHPHSNSTTASGSPHSPPPDKGVVSTSTRPSLASGGRKSRRSKAVEDTVDETQASAAASSASSSSTTQGRSRRKVNDKDEGSVDARSGTNTALKAGEGNSRDPSASLQEEDEEQGITRCICRSTAEDDPDAGEFMVQCETCKAWQHGLCMGYEAEDQLPDDDYHCEVCRPDLHPDIIKKALKRPRHPSATAVHTEASTVVAQSNSSRISRSHSPSHSSRPAKRRNTMNSRDANFDLIFKETLAATAAEAEAAACEEGAESIIGFGEDAEGGASANSKKKRKRVEDDAESRKQNRSVSCASDNPAHVANPKSGAPSSGTSTKNPSRNKRGGARKSAAAAAAMIREVGALDAEEAPASKRSSHGSRNRSSQSRRPQASGAGPQALVQANAEARRNYANPAHSGAGISISASGTGSGAGNSGGGGSSASAYRNTHAYAVSQQPLFTSWGLPDYLAHLEQMLPSAVPAPLMVGNERERGVRVRWPGKRMSVGDMNRRVRALVEWVGREQASKGERERRREMLAESRKRSAWMSSDKMEVDTEAGETGKPYADGMTSGTGTGIGPAAGSEGGLGGPTMKMMEELMEELIGFQERFGPGLKTRERERRAAGS